MKVLHISPSYYPAFRYGGPIQSVHLLNTSLASKGVHVDVLTTNAGLEKDNIRLHTWVDVDNVRVMYCRYYGYHHFNFSPQMFWKLLKLVKEYDLVHITAVWNFPVVAGSIASILRKKPFIISPRGTIYPETLLKKSRLAKKIYYNLISKHCLNRSIIHFTTSDEQEKVYAFLQLKARSFVVANGIKTQEFSKEIPKNLFTNKYLKDSHKKYILFFSRISWKKGLDILIPAYLKLRERLPQVSLIIAGPDDENYRTEIEKLIPNDAQKSIIFTEMLTGDDRIAAYREADCFVLPSYSENFGMVVVEAMVSGTPIVISDKVGIYLDIQKNRAGIICQTNIESVCESLHQMLTNSTFRSELTQNALELVNNFYTLEKTTEIMLDHYRKIINCEYR